MPREEEPMPKSIAELIRDEVRRRVDEALKPSRARIEKLVARASAIDEGGDD